jgi:hypothetical protein
MSILDLTFNYFKDVYEIICKFILKSIFSSYQINNYQIFIQIVISIILILLTIGEYHYFN